MENVYLSGKIKHKNTKEEDIYFYLDKSLQIYLDRRMYRGRHTSKISNEKMKNIQNWLNATNYKGKYNTLGERDGKGTEIYGNGNKYEGEFKADKRNRHGIMISICGDKYDGEWKDNKRHGRGVMTWANGAKYDGE